MKDRPLAAIVLAAGMATRMRSARPKVLHEVAGRSALAHVLATLETLTPAQVLTVVSKDNQAAIKAAVPALDAVLQDPPLGTGHAVASAQQALSGFAGDILVLFADSPLVRSETLAAMVARRRQADDPAVVVLGVRLADPSGYGRLVLDGDGHLERIVEDAEEDGNEKASDLCNAAVMAIDGAILFELVDRITNDNGKGEYYLTDIVALARARGRVAAVVEGQEEEMIGIDSRAKLAAAEAAAQFRLRHAALENGVTMIDPETVWLSQDTVLEADVTIEPSVFFGPGVTVRAGATIRAFCHLEGCTIESGAAIGPFARLRPETHVGEGARIGNFVEVKKARIEAGAKANHLSYIGDARIGGGANIGAGTITCNYDGVSKWDTDIGIGAFVGSNTALVAPVTVGDGAIIGAGSTITKDVHADSITVARAEQRARFGIANAYRQRLRTEAGKEPKR